jgi:hypothetical protein
MNLKGLGFKILEWIKLLQDMCPAMNKAIIFGFYLRRESGHLLKNDLRV